MNSFFDPAPRDEAQRDLAAGREWAADLAVEGARQRFEPEDLAHHLTDDPDKLYALCRALHPLIYRRSGDEITEAVQSIAEPVIERMAQGERA